MFCSTVILVISIQRIWVQRFLQFGEKTAVQRSLSLGSEIFVVCVRAVYSLGSGFCAVLGENFGTEIFCSLV